MTQVLKIVGPQITLTATPNTVLTNITAGAIPPTPNTASGGVAPSVQPGGGTVVRVLNTDPGLVLITVANSGVNTGSITLTSMNGEYIRKYPYDTIQSNNGSNTFATPIAFTN